MRRVIRQPLEQDVQADLDARQTSINRKLNSPGFSATDEWKTARQTRTLNEVRTILQRMMGERQRCMYCLDSHGTDIEHFWPKKPYPERMFVWLNLILCCAECGRFKGDRFPFADNAPLLVDPTAEDPWEQLDFDPATGNVVARFDTASNAWTAKGQVTVDLLQLDRREAMAAGYQRTYRRLAEIVTRALGQPEPDPDTLRAHLSAADDHGLLTWCFHRSGRNETPFSDLRKRHPDVWTACAAAFA